MQLTALRQRLRELGAKSAHETLFLRNWARALPLDHGRPAGYFPKTLQTELPCLAEALAGLARLQEVAMGEGGSSRALIALADGQTVESVLLPRRGLCVSTQVGCAVGCVFCMTGRGGLLRQMGSAEIVAQVVEARHRREVRKVVFMGMGEPAHNLDNVLEAIDLLGMLGDIGHKNLVLSTVGDPRIFERLPHCAVKPALAVSLHSTDAAKRASLLPRAPRFDPAELVARAEHYARATGYPIQYQWTLIEGVNDGGDEIEGIAQLLAGKRAVMNLIPFNAVDGLAFNRPAPERTAAMSMALYRRGILTKIRNSAGQDIEGACGQLRARAVAAKERIIAL